MKPFTTQNLVKIISALGIGLMLTACATNSQNVATDARASLGKITEKQTIQQYEQRRTSPVDVSVGVGGGGGSNGAANNGSVVAHQFHRSPPYHIELQSVS